MSESPSVKPSSEPALQPTTYVLQNSAENKSAQDIPPNIITWRQYYTCLSSWLNILQTRKKLEARYRKWNQQIFDGVKGEKLRKILALYFNKNINFDSSMTVAGFKDAMKGCGMIWGGYDDFYDIIMRILEEDFLTPEGLCSSIINAMPDKARLHLQVKYPDTSTLSANMGSSISVKQSQSQQKIMPEPSAVTIKQPAKSEKERQHARAA